VLHCSHSQNAEHPYKWRICEHAFRVWFLHWKWVGLLWLNTGSDIHFTESQITKHLRTSQNFKGDRFLPTSKFRMLTAMPWRRWCSVSSAAKSKYKHMQNFQDSWCSTQIWRILHHDGFYPYHFQRVQHILLGDHISSVQFCGYLQPQPHTLHDIQFMGEN
jgi:hypothetical protein